MKKISIYYVLFTLTYIALVLISTPFLATWGRKRGILEQLYVWFLTKPLDITISLWLIFANSLFWLIIIYFLVGLFKKYRL